MAADFVEGIADERQRQSRMENIANNWLNQDEAAARAWIEKTAFPELVKKRLLERNRN